MSDPAEFSSSAADAEQDAMAAEWGAALAQPASSPASAMTDDPFSAAASEVSDPVQQATPAAFANFGASVPGYAGGQRHQHDPRHPRAADGGVGVHAHSHQRTSCSWRTARLWNWMPRPVSQWTCWSDGFLIAQGEVVVVNDKFVSACTHIVTPSERMRRLSRGN